MTDDVLHVKPDDVDGSADPLQVVFEIPKSQQGECECGTSVFGPPGAKCEACVRAWQVSDWTRYIRTAHQVAIESLPHRFVGVGYAEIAASFNEPVKRLKNPKALEQAKKCVTSVILRGASAAGKTTLACAMFQAKLDAFASIGQDITGDAKERAMSAASAMGTARFVRAYKLGALQAWSEELHQYRDAAYLVIDDLMLEAVTLAPTIIDVVIDRIDNDLPTVITTAFKDEQLEQRYGEGVIRRLYQGHAPIECGATGGGR